MKILKFELKKQFLTVVIWEVIIIGIFASLMLALYPIYLESKADVMKILDGFPPKFAAAFGLQVSDMFSFGGFYSFSFSYIGLIGGIMAAYLAISSFSRENRNKCSDFLLTKPVSRKSIFVQKLLSGLGLLVATNIIFIIVAILIGQKNDTNMFLASLSLFLTQLVFFAIGIVYSSFAKKVRSVSGIATMFGFIAFILSALINILDEKALRFVAPLKYFDPAAVFADGGYEVQYALTGIAIILGCVTLSYFRFVNSDTKSV